MSAFDAIKNIHRPMNAIVWGTAPPRDPVIADWLGAGSQTSSGSAVTADSAMRVNTVYACINRISNTIAQTPLLLYQELPTDQGKQRDKQNPLYTLLHRKPNSWQTPFEFKQMMAAHVALRGNAYAAIVSTAISAVSALIPLHPDRVTPFWTADQQRAYRYQPLSGPPQIFLPGEILHVQGLSFDGLKGISPIQYCRESIGIAMATEEHGARLFSNGAQVGMALKHPGQLTAKASDNLKKHFEQRYSGVGNAHRTMLLEEGMSVEKLGLTAEDSQFLETRAFQVADIARIWEMPLHMIGDLSGSTNNNIEQQSLEFVQYTMGPWFTRFEEALDRDLVYQPDRYFEFLVDGLLRGDIRSRYAAYAIGKQWGWLSANDIRQKENLNPIEGGDTYFAPLNMAPVDAASLLNDPGQAPPKKD